MWKTGPRHGGVCDSSARGEGGFSEAECEGLAVLGDDDAITVMMVILVSLLM